MPCFSRCATVVAIAILVIVLLMLVSVWILWNELQSNFQSHYRTALLQRCAGTVEYQENRDLGDLTLRPEEYQYDLALTLLNTSIRVTRAACTPALPRVRMSGYRTTYLMAQNPYGKGERRQFAVVLQNRRRICMIFDGTMFKDEWVADFDFPQVEPESLKGYRKGMLVHTGFYRVYSSIRAQLWTLFRANPNSERELVITGHSLGAAVSNLAALDFSQYHPLHYTYGCPRTGNRVWADTFQKKVPHSWRVYNAEDLITEVPPPVILQWVYCHVGQPVTFDINLGSIQANHVTSYLQHLPQQACYSH